MGFESRAYAPEGCFEVGRGNVAVVEGAVAGVVCEQVLEQRHALRVGIASTFERCGDLQHLRADGGCAVVEEHGLATGDRVGVVGAGCCFA